MAPNNAGYNKDDTTELNPIANAPALEAPNDREIPNDYEFEILRLRRRVQDLESIVRDKDDRLAKALSILEYELLFWRTGMIDHVWETIGGIMRRIGKLDAALKYLRQSNSRFYPPLEVPAAWKKRSSVTEK